MQKQAQHGFTLIELMIVIIGILAAVALPAYDNYTKGAKFAEVVAAVVPYKIGVELAIQKQGTGCATLATSVKNECGIPDDATASGVVQSVGVNAGIIKATGTADDVDSATFILTPSGPKAPVTWAQPHIRLVLITAHCQPPKGVRSL